MCPPIFKTPEPPELPEARPTAPMPEKTAKAPTVGTKRTTSTRTGRGRRSFRRLGTSSLRIPLNTGMGSGNLNY